MQPWTVGGERGSERLCLANQCFEIRGADQVADVGEAERHACGRILEREGAYSVRELVVEQS